MCGASAIQSVSSLLYNGPGHIGTMLAGMTAWMEEKEYESLRQMRGCMNIVRSPNAQEYARANYMQMLQTWEA